MTQNQRADIDEFVDSYKRGDDITGAIDAVTVSNVIQGVFYALYINLVVLQYRRPPFFYGLYDLTLSSTNSPGTFVDRRYSLFWFFMLIQVARLLMYMFYQLLANTKQYSRWLFTIHQFFNVAYLVFDVVYLMFVIFAYGWNCNSVLWAENPCNDVNFCKAYGDILTTICRPDEHDPAFSPLLLVRNVIFTGETIFACIFIALDLMQLVVVRELKLSIARFVRMYSKE